MVGRDFCTRSTGHFFFLPTDPDPIDRISRYNHLTLEILSFDPVSEKDGQIRRNPGAHFKTRHTFDAFYLLIFYFCYTTNLSPTSRHEIAIVG